MEDVVVVVVGKEHTHTHGVSGCTVLTSCQAYQADCGPVSSCVVLSDSLKLGD